MGRPDGGLEASRSRSHRGTKTFEFDEEQLEGRGEGQDGPRRLQDGPQRAQDGPKMAPRGSKMAPKDPKMAPREPKIAPTSPKTPPGQRSSPFCGPFGPPKGPPEPLKLDTGDPEKVTTSMRILHFFTFEALSKQGSRVGRLKAG